ncbi:MAG TPA: zinc-dependent metalloprotease, partial [Flavisolibacter sp.]|nr:zinc-dependent metalloprotease [Flavisolibacter sp.]
SIEDKTKNLKAYKGFLNFYWDENSGKILLEINQLDKEILYHTSLPAGLGSNDVGLDRGLMGNTAIVKFTRAGNKVLMIQPNYDFRAVSNDASERRAVEQSFAQSTLWGFTVEAQGNGSVLVDATPFLLRDAMGVSARLQNTRQGTFTIDPTRSAIYLERTKNFPLNTELETTITFTTRDARPGNFVGSVAPASDAITLRMHHSFMQLPPSGYEPREFDPRSGCINTSFFDYSTPVTEPIQKHYIIRHRLQKKDPTAAVSEAVKPIVYYLDNGTPEPIRSALLEGGQWWNQAFEAAGYKDAFQVKILPDTADPMDLRYNMINWVHRSTRGWSYGAAVVDPRTGEIIKGNVTLGSLRVRKDYLIVTGLLSPFKPGVEKDDRMLAMSLQRLKQLSAHEIGHTIGFMHNYISSTQGKASVMDYPAPDAFINAKGEIDLSNAYTNAIGDWDKVTVAYAYQDFPAGTNEKQALNKILTDAAARGLTFISDRDARDAAGIHPQAHLWDNDQDVVAGLRKVMQVRQKALLQFGANTIRNGVAYSMLEDALVPIYLYHRYQVEAATKLVGGLNYSYAVKGDGQVITRPVSRQDQLKALNAVMDCIDPDFLALSKNITDLIPPRPAGYGYTRELFSKRTGLAFDPLAAAETAADLPLQFLFNPARLNRMSQFAATQNSLGIDDMMQALMNQTWKAKRLTGLQGLIQQQNEQLILGYAMSVAVSDEASFATKAAMLQWIDAIKRLATQQLVSATNKGHYMLALQRIEKKAEAKPFLTPAIPPGAPIGCEEF